MSNSIGLCLSGGGFRASFFHIGILAQMAEKGLLRHVEVISTVSGGSILGVAYYILLKRLLESKSDADIVDQDYVDLVAELEASFKQGVANNIRMRTFLNPIANMRMAFSDYSRSDQIGKLYTQYLYLPIFNKNRPEGEKVTEINLTNLHIFPKEQDGFHPYKGKDTNKNRVNKVPILVINSTNLCSGNNWVFTASGMGEIPPRNDVFYDIDKKDRYPYTSYNKIETREVKGFPVGAAVAASACVPGLFPPMAVSDLYLNRRVQLVDGGVFDNQGIAGALWTLEASGSCDYFVVSDASGQGDGAKKVATDAFSVLGSVPSILTSRIREEMLNTLVKQASTHVEFFHLTRGLFAKKILVNKKGEISDEKEAREHGVTSCKEAFNITQKNQHLLSKVRTDLDAFSDYEVFSLEKDAYQMSENGLQTLRDNMGLKGKPLSKAKLVTHWRFKDLGERLGDDDKELEKQLSIAKSLFFKTFRHNFLLALLVHIPLILFFLLVAISVNYLLAIYNPEFWNQLLNYRLVDFFWFLIGGLAIYLLSWIGDRLVGEKVTLLIRLLKGPYKLIKILVLNIVSPILIAIPVWIFLRTVNPLFIKLGRLRK